MAPITANTKEKLLDAAQDVIQRRGLNGMSFQDLSDAVGIRKASVHHHFASKAEMVDALLERYLADISAFVAEILKSRGSGKTKLKRYCDLFVGTLKSGKHDKACLCGVLMAELLSLDNNAQQRVRDFLQLNTNAIESILREGVKDESLSVQGNIKGTARLVLATLEGGLLIARCDGGPKQLADMVSRLLQLLTS